MPYTKDPCLGALWFYLRTDGEPQPMTAALRSAIKRLDPNVPVNDMCTITAQISDSTFNARLLATLSVSLALLAGLMAALRLYSDILRLVISQGFRLAVIGGAIGGFLALIASPSAASLLYGINAHAPVTFLAVSVLLAMVSGLACYLHHDSRPRSIP